MDVFYWTFPHIGGKWSICPGNSNRLQSGAMVLVVEEWSTIPGIGITPYVRDNNNQRAVSGTRWVEGPAVQEGNAPKSEKSGGSVDYYQVKITHPTTKGRDPYTAECNDIIEALGMNYAEGNSFKALWRSCAARTLGKLKEGGDAVYDAEKNVFFANRILIQRKESHAN
jgi:hypothetical protein